MFTLQLHRCLQWPWNDLLVCVCVCVCVCVYSSHRDSSSDWLSVPVSGDGLHCHTQCQHRFLPSLLPERVSCHQTGENSLLSLSLSPSSFSCFTCFLLILLLLSPGWNCHHISLLCHYFPGNDLFLLITIILQIPILILVTSIINTWKLRTYFLTNHWKVSQILLVSECSRMASASC